MTKSVWYRAAELVVKTNSLACCGCIYELGKSKMQKANMKTKFVKFFKPHNISEYSIWWGQ